MLKNLLAMNICSWMHGFMMGMLESWLADSQTLFSRVKIVKILAQFSFKCQQLASMFVRCCTCACYNFYAWKPWLNNVIKGFCNAWTQKELFIPAMQLKNCALSAAFCFSFGFRNVCVVNSCGWTRKTLFALCKCTRFNCFCVDGCVARISSAHLNTQASEEAIGAALSDDHVRWRVINSLHRFFSAPWIIKNA